MWREMHSSDMRCPIARDRVLLYDPALGIMMAYFETGRGWTSVDTGNRVSISPTHWHPLPAPPERN